MLVNTENGFRHFMNWLSAQEVVALDTETTGLKLYTGDKMVGVSVGNGEHSYYIPFRHGEGRNLPETLIKPLVELLQQKHLLMHNASFDLKVLANEGWDIEEISFQDTQIAQHLINEQEESFALKKLCDKYGLGIGSKDEDELYQKVADLTGKRGSRQWKGYMWMLSGAEVEPYACTDVDLTWALWEAQAPALQRLGYLEETIEEDPGGLYWGMMEYAKAVAVMEHRGIRLDRGLLLQYKEDAGKIAEENLQALREIARDKYNYEHWEKFNPGSPIQPKQVFGWENCKAETLEALGTEEAELTLNYKAYMKATGSYYDAYLLAMDNDDILHPNFNLTGTGTGRLSAYSPNLQAVPRYNERQPIKDLFVSRDDHYLIELDLAQAELRVVAYFANVEGMLETFRRGTDLHTDTAESFGLPRDVAKRINLSAVFGIGAKTFAEKYKVPVEQAKEWLDTYHAGYPQIKEFYYGMLSVAERDHEIKLMTGKTRHYRKKEFSKHSPLGYNYGEQRASSNFIQGTVAELMRIAMLRVVRDEELSDVNMLLTVHDSILVEVPDHREPEEVAARIMHHMTNFGDMPLEADAKWGSRWGAMQEIEWRT